MCNITNGMLTADQHKLVIKQHQAIARIGANMALYGNPFGPVSTKTKKKRRKKTF